MELQIIQRKIYEIRGQRVMLDFDLAELYEVETKRMKEAIRRNIVRFPSDFMFELISAEFKNLRTQIASSSWGGSRYPPFARIKCILDQMRFLRSQFVILETQLEVTNCDFKSEKPDFLTL